MRPPRWLVYAVFVLTALLAQLVVLNRLAIPGGHPLLLVVVVVACALAAGPLAGTVTGFGAGLLADLTPPAQDSIGRTALVLAIVGYLAGLVEDTGERSVLVPFVLVGLASAGAVLGFAALGAILGDHRAAWGGFVSSLPFEVLYDLVLTPFVVPLVAVVTRRLQPEVSLR